MKNSHQRILELANHHAFIRPRDLAALGVFRTELSGLVRHGLLHRVGRGLYSLPERTVSEHYGLAVVATKCPHGVICLLSALQFHELTTQAPFEVWLAIPNKARAPKLDYPLLRIVRFSDKVVHDGVEEHQIDGIPVRVTSVARTIVDCFKFRHKIGLDVALEALSEGWRYKRFSMDELWHYAVLCRVSNVIRPYLESLS